MCAYYCIGILGVPIFFMISGAIFLNNNYQLSIKKLYKTKVLHLTFLYLFWLLFYNFYTFFSDGRPFNKLALMDILYNTINGQGIYHLWFLPELIVLYMISPLLKNVFQSKKICEYYLILYCIFGGLLQTILRFDFETKELLMSIKNRTSLVMLTGYIGFFVLGHYLHTFWIDRKSLRLKILYTFLSIASTAFIVIVCIVNSVKEGHPEIIMNTPLELFHIIACNCLFLLARDLKFKDRSISLFGKLSKYTLGTYLVHPVFVILLQKIGLSTQVSHPLLIVPVMTVLVFLLSFGTTFVFSRIPGVRRVVM